MHHCTRILRISIVAAALATAGCADDDGPSVDCGDGEFVDSTVGRFCVYVQAVSGIECPSEVPFRIPVGDALVCAEEYVSPTQLPTNVCQALGSACQQIDDAAGPPMDASAGTDSGRDGGRDSGLHDSGLPGDGAVDAAATDASFDATVNDAGRDAGTEDAGGTDAGVVDCTGYTPPTCNGASCNVTCAEAGEVPCAAGCCDNNGTTGFSVGELTYDLPEYQLRMAVDNTDTPHVVYEELGEIWYWVPSYGTNGIRWVGPEPEVEPDDFYLKPHIALDSSNVPYILAIQDFSPDGNFARLAGAEWEIGDAPRGFGLQVDGKGRPHIAALATDEVQYRAWNGASFVLQTIPAEGVSPGGDRFAEYDGDFVLDSQDRPHIVVEGTTENNFRYIHWTGSEWDVEVVEAGGRAFRPKIAVDGNDMPHVLIQGASGIAYGRRTETDWVFTAVDSDTGSRAPYALDVDACGRPHIAYQVYEDRKDYFRWFRYAVWTGTQWARLDLNPGSSYNQNGDIDIVAPSPDRVHIVWQDFDHVLYRRIPTGPWTSPP